MSSAFYDRPIYLFRTEPLPFSLLDHHVMNPTSNRVCMTTPASPALGTGFVCPTCSRDRRNLVCMSRKKDQWWKLEDRRRKSKLFSPRSLLGYPLSFLVHDYSERYHL